jgi:6-phosphogluconolactonase
VPDSPPELHVVADPSIPVGDLLAEYARRGASIVLTGGSGVAEAYGRAASLAPDWSAATVWWGDERCVPPGDDLSNYKLAKESLLDKLEAKPRHVHRIRGELQPADAAGEYDKLLEHAALDFLLLGLGPDGHCASLFPASPQLHVTDRRAVSGTAGLEPWVDRVTLTMPELQSAGRIVFIASGERKAEAVRRAFGEEITDDVPASLLRRAAVPVEVYIDHAAASELETR